MTTDKSPGGQAEASGVDEVIKEAFREKIDTNVLRGNYSLNSVKMLMYGSFREGFEAALKFMAKEVISECNRVTCEHNEEAT